MNVPVSFALLSLAGYLLGSIPFGWLIARARGIELREVGSKNIGATNVFRSVGKGRGVLALVLDAAKGFIPAYAFCRWFPEAASLPAVAGEAGLVWGVCAIAGHNWPVWLKFRGGKGVATSAGVLLGVAPAAIGIALLVFAVVLAVTRRVSVGSILAAAAACAAGWYFYSARPVLAVALSVLAVLVVVRHKSNIARLLRGQEPPLW
ncbi:MAG: glycerol-3-phosphate 1-O-acyltransferase PlsY [Kiritimatiellae bacterium]|nr:glycerol-3-phosphate 1-O-acyltransferase PlsY [Kiritimatiellia bacterium]